MNKEKTISVCGIDAEIVLFEGKRYFKIPIEKGLSISDYRQKALACIGSPYLVSMRFVEEADRLYAYYDFSGYMQLKDAYTVWIDENKNPSCSLIEVINGVIRAILSIENYLFINDGYYLTEDTVFINTKTEGVKLAFVPENESRNDIVEKLSVLVNDTAAGMKDQQWNYYSKLIEKRVFNHSASLGAAEKKLFELGREIHLSI